MYVYIYIYIYTHTHTYKFTRRETRGASPGGVGVHLLADLLCELLLMGLIEHRDRQTSRSDLLFLIHVHVPNVLPDPGALNYCMHTCPENTMLDLLELSASVLCIWKFDMGFETLKLLFCLFLHIDILITDRKTGFLTHGCLVLRPCQVVRGRYAHHCARHPRWPQWFGTDPFRAALLRVRGE